MSDTPKTIKIATHWDSGPFGTYWEANQDEAPRPEGGKLGYGIAEIPVELWEAYDAATKVKDCLEVLMGQYIPKPPA